MGTMISRMHANCIEISDNVRIDYIVPTDEILGRSWKLAASAMEMDFVSVE